MTIPHLYGIKNCDTVRKARKWLQMEGVNHEFIDLREGTLPATLLNSWLDGVGLETLLNKNSTSWRGLSDDQKKQMDRESAVQLMQDTPTLIKRPVLVTENAIQVGFTPQTYQALLLKENSENE